MRFEWDSAPRDEVFCGFEEADGKEERGPRELKCPLSVASGRVERSFGFHIWSQETRREGASKDRLVSPGGNRNQDVSTNAPCFTDSHRSCSAVSLSMMTMGPPQSGQVQVAGVGAWGICDEGEGGGAVVQSSC